jgi:hypothetical protein
LPEIRGIQKFLGFFRRETGQKSAARQPVWKIAQPRRPVWKISHLVWKIAEPRRPVLKTVKMRQPTHYFAYCDIRFPHLPARNRGF